MKEWTKKQKILVVSAFAVVLVVAGILAAVFNYRATSEGVKAFRVEVTSERDGYSQTTDFKSKEEFLGGFLRKMNGCEWREAEYGIYITGFDGMEEDKSNQYWWSIMVNGKSATTGADEIPLQDGDTYQFVLMQGW